jgi:hypothetical protein
LEIFKGLPMVFTPPIISQHRRQGLQDPILKSSDEADGSSPSSLPQRQRFFLLLAKSPGSLGP